MKTLGIERATLDTCIREAQGERVLLTRSGVPVAIVVGLEGLDEEQLELGSSDEFWKLISQRRQQRTISRSELKHGAGGVPKTYRGPRLVSAARNKRAD